VEAPAEARKFLAQSRVVRRELLFDLAKSRLVVFRELRHARSPPFIAVGGHRRAGIRAAPRIAGARRMRTAQLRSSCFQFCSPKHPQSTRGADLSENKAVHGVAQGVAQGRAAAAPQFLCRVLTDCDRRNRSVAPLSADAAQEHAETMKKYWAFFWTAALTAAGE